MSLLLRKDVCVCFKSSIKVGSLALGGGLVMSANGVDQYIAVLGDVLGPATSTATFNAQSGAVSFGSISGATSLTLQASQGATCFGSLSAQSLTLQRTPLSLGDGQLFNVGTCASAFPSASRIIVSG